MQARTIDYQVDKILVCNRCWSETTQRSYYVKLRCTCGNGSMFSIKLYENKSDKSVATLPCLVDDKGKKKLIVSDKLENYPKRSRDGR